MSFRELQAMLAKNLQLLLRAKAGLVILLLGPLLLIIIAGVAFDHSEPFAVSVGVYSEEYTTTTNSFIDRLGDANFAVQTYESASACTSAIKAGQEDACIVFPPSFDGTNPDQTVEFTVDFNQVNLVNHILNVFETEISKEQDEARRRLATSLIEAVNVAKEEVNKDKPLLIGLATGVEAIKTHAQDASTALKDVQLQSQTTSTLPNINQSIGEIFDTLIFDTNASIQQAREDLTDTINQSNETSTIEELEDIDSELALLQSTLGSQSAIIDGRLDNLTAATNLLTSELGSVVGRLTQLSAQKDVVAAKLGSVESRVQDNLVIALKLQESVNKLSSSLDGLAVSSVDQLARPFRTVVNPVTAKQTYLAYLFPSLVALLAMFGALLIGPSLVHVELASPALVRTRLARKPVLFFLATLLTVVVAVCAQLLMVYGVAVYFLNGVSYVALLQSALVALGATVFFAGVGIAIGYSFKSESTALTAAVALCAILLFSSNVLLPIESMPTLLRAVLSYNPITFGESIMRNLMLYGSSLLQFVSSMLIGLAATVLAVVGAFFSVRRKL